MMDGSGRVVVEAKKARCVGDGRGFGGGGGVEMISSLGGVLI